MGIIINENSEVKVFINEFKTGGTVRLSYSTSISSKNVEGEFTNFFVNINFSKEVLDTTEFDTLENGSVIVLENAWFKPYQTSKGEVKLALFVNSMHIKVEEKEEKKPETKKTAKSNTYNKK